MWWYTVAMNYYIAFFRGINVGGRIIKMSDLTACFASVGLKNVKTILQTGNVVFASDTSNLADLRNIIESAVSRQFGYDAKIQVYPSEQVKKVIDEYPFDTSEEDRQHYVVFLDEGLAQDLITEASNLDQTIEKISLGDGVVYWQVPKGMTLKTDFSKYLTKAKYREGNTVRNIKTLKKCFI
jgi:uncharacterized protein (DUF1697 family)